MFVSCFVVCMCVEFIVHVLMYTACASGARGEESGVSRAVGLVGKIRKTKAKQRHIYSYITFNCGEDTMYKQTNKQTNIYNVLATHR